MKLRRLILLPSDEDKRTSDSALEGEDGPDWGLLTEVDRLRTTSSGLSAEVQRQTQIGQDYARAVSEKRVRVEELERENAIAHSNCQMLERRLSQTEERALELEELVEVLRAQRDRLQTYCEQQKDRADGLDAAFAAVRDAAGALLAAGDRQTHAALGTRGLARAKVEYADALAGLRRALERNAGRDFLAPDVVDDVRRFFTSENLAVEEKKKLSQNIVRALSTGD
jgi:chromosome segregation ATPase